MPLEDNKSNGSNIGLVLVSKDRCVIGANNYALKLLDIDKSCLGKTFSQSIPIKEHVWIDNLIRNNSPENRELPYVVRVNALNKDLLVYVSALESSINENDVFALTLMDSSQNESQMGVKPDYKKRNKISINSGGMRYLIDIASVYSIKSEGNYCRIYTKDHHYFVRMTLKEIINNHEAGSLFQVHKSYLVNLDYINRIKMDKNGGALIELGNKQIPSVPVAYRRLKILKDVLFLKKIPVDYLKNCQIEGVR